LSTQDLLESLEIPRSTFFTLINSLKALGYVEQDEARGPYTAGKKLLTWISSKTLVEKELLDAFREEIAAIQRSSSPAAALKETLALATPRPHGILIADQVPSTQRVRVVYDSGQALPLTETAAGIWFSNNALTETARSDGYAHMEFDSHSELSLPITLDGSTASAAIVIAAPSARLSGDHLLEVLPTLHELAARISIRMGAPYYTPFKTQSNPALQPHSGLSKTEINSFLQGLHVARLACLKPDGTPHVVPVWQTWDGKALYVAAWEGSLWPQYLEQNSSVSLSVDEPWSPMRRVMIKGHAQALEENDLPGGTKALVASLRERYLGSPTLDPGLEWQAFRIVPDSIRGWQGLVR